MASCWPTAQPRPGAASPGGVTDAVRQMLNNLPHVKLVENGWQPWPQFRNTVRHMHLLLQPSYTESFNVVTADGIAEGVPSVVSDAIEWAPGSPARRLSQSSVSASRIRLGPIELTFISKSRAYP